MKKILLTILRDKECSRQKFRETADKMAACLAIDVAELLTQEKIPVQTPLAKASGSQFKKPMVLIPVLRAGLALLPSFIHFFVDARVGTLGFRRDEKTSIATLYYHNIPTINSNDDVVILEPMIATGGTTSQALNFLKERGVQQEQIIIASVVAAPEGLQVIQKDFPKVRFVIAQVDEGLNDKYYIIPGLGDFGDRYFGT